MRRALRETTGLGRCWSVAGLILLLASGSAWAQAVPGPAQPGRLPQQLAPAVPPPSVSPTPPVQIPAPPSHAVVVPQFVLRQVVVEGATIYSPDTLAALYAPYIGQPADSGTIAKIEQAITVKYRDDGYILSRAIADSVNPQTGVVHVRVFEGYVDKVDIQPGDTGGALRGILEQIAHACHDGDQPRAGQPCPLNRDELERYLLMANDLPGVQASAVIQPSPNQVGAADLVVTVTQKPFDLSASLDNRNPVYFGRWRMAQSATGNNLLGLYDRTQVTTTESLPFKDLFGVGVTEQVPLGATGLTLAVGGSHSRARPGDALRPLNLRATADEGQLTLSYPLIRTRAQNLLLSAGIDLVNAHQHSFDATLFNDKARAVVAGAIYNLADAWNGTNTVDGGLTQGVNIMGATPENSLVSSHLGAPPDFTKADAEISRLQQLFPEWGLLGAATGQYSWSRLLAGEQFDFGGANYGRAYDESEILGDRGLAAKAELQYTPAWGPDLLGADVLKSLQFYTYYDIGRAWVLDHPEPHHLTGASVGGGVRVGITPYLSSYVEIAKPLTRPVQADVLDGRSGKGPRFFVSLMATY